MHIMEGFLPAEHALAWGLAALPCVAIGLRSIRRRVRANPEFKLLLGVSAAFTFALTALKLPSVTGSSSHPTGTGLGAALFGPLAMAPVATIVLLFQALLLAHGGLTTLGANVVSLGVVGPLVAFVLFRGGVLFRLPQRIALFLAVAVADLATYLTTSLQLALAFPDPVGGVAGAFAKFAGIFALTQIPLALAEGVLSVLVFSQLTKYNGRDLGDLGVPPVRQTARP
jgi:cobalt/nickel transport system permease protein